MIRMFIPAMLFAIASSPLKADEPKTAPMAPTKNASGELVKSGPPLSTDSAFDRYTNLALVGRAIELRDAGLILDLALQLAEGERVLLRNHQSGVTSKVLIAKALQIATETNDKATIDRLAKAAEKLGDAALVKEIATAKKLGGVERAIDPALSVNIDSLDIADLMRMKGFIERIKSAQLLGDADELVGCEDDLKNATIPNAQKDAIKKMLASARSSIPKESSDEMKALTKLTGESRKNPFKNTPFDTDTWQQTGRDIDRERLNQMDRNPRKGRDYTELHIKNSTNKEVYVAFRILPYQFPSNDSRTLEYVEDKDGPFDTFAWYTVQPGQRLYISPTANTTVYYFAEGGGKVWKGTHAANVPAGNGTRRVMMRERIINAPYAEEETINLTP